MTVSLVQFRHGGARSISPEASAVYDCQAVLDFAANGWELLRYEMLPPDPALVSHGQE